MNNTDCIKLINITGNVIPREWYKVFVKKNLKVPKPHLLAINLLADIVYWYRPSVIYDDKGNAVGYKKKFHSDMLQRSYSQITEFMGCTKYQAKDAAAFLESMGVIKRHYRNTASLRNVMYIELNIEKLNELTYQSKNPIHENSDTIKPLASKNLTYGCENFATSNGENFNGGGSKFQQTYTKNTTKTTAKTSSQTSANSFSPKVKPRDDGDNSEIKELLNSMGIDNLRHQNMKEFMVSLISSLYKTKRVGQKTYSREELKKSLGQLTSGDIDTVIDRYISAAARGNITNSDSYLKTSLISAGREKEILTLAKKGGGEGIHCGCPSFDIEEYTRMSIEGLMRE